MIKPCGRFSTSATVRTLDTNVLVRLFIVDDEHQSAVALTIINDPFLILPTVLLELIWVLSSRYGLKREAFLPKLTALLGMSNAYVAFDPAVFWALSRYEAGADFADMLHIALAKELEATTFATFDKRIKADIVQDLDLALETLT
jgi:predicted nucleic-acid-binding protein